jgi:hypothetical protein
MKFFRIRSIALVESESSLSPLLLPVTALADHREIPNFSFEILFSCAENEEMVPSWLRIIRDKSQFIQFLITLTKYFPAYAQPLFFVISSLPSSHSSSTQLRSISAFHGVKDLLNEIFEKENVTISVGLLQYPMLMEFFFEDPRRPFSSIERCILTHNLRSVSDMMIILIWI